MNIKNPILKEIWDWVKVLVLAAAIALFLNNFIITNSFVPTGSMIDTLPIGSRVFGFRLQYLFSKPKRGDIVVFDFGFICKKCGEMYQKNDEGKCPTCGSLSSQNKKAHYVKRVIGLPGEHIEIKRDYPVDKELFNMNIRGDSDKVWCGHVYINGESLEENYIREPMIVADNSSFPSMDIVVPEDSYFCLGDNRNNSLDARFWPKTFVPIKDIESKAWILYWPLNRFTILH